MYCRLNITLYPSDRDATLLLKIDPCAKHRGLSGFETKRHPIHYCGARPNNVWQNFFVESLPLGVGNYFSEQSTLQNDYIYLFVL